MNTKKIWILAIIFGVAMASIFYIVTLNRGNTIDNSAVEPSIADETQEEPDNEMNSPNPLPITAGKRAISITVNEVQSVSRFIQPGSYVDIIALLPAGMAQNTPSQMIIENVRVLAVGRTILVEEETRAEDEPESEPEPYQMVTLEVNPKDGASLAYAKEVGSVTLMLRGPEAEFQTP